MATTQELVDAVAAEVGANTPQAVYAGIAQFVDDALTSSGSASASTLMVAGAGLTGGGDLAADRTFNVGAHADASIVVNANDIQVGVLASDTQHGARGGGTQHAVAVAAGAAGFMTGADKTKLDGIAAGATNNTLVVTSSPPVDVSKAAAAVGTAVDAARADHKHDVATTSASANPPGSVSAEGNSASLARADHTHALAAFGSSAGTFAQGDDSRLSDDRVASGLRTASTVVVTSGATAPTAGQVLQASSSTLAAWQTLATAVPVQTAEIDFGVTPTAWKTAVVVDAAVSPASKILVSQSGIAATGREADEAEMDPLVASCLAGAGFFVVNLAAQAGPVVGLFKLQYTVG